MNELSTSRRNELIDRQETMQSPKPLPDPLPDAQQRHHFWHTEKSCMLQAGAGCGKTTDEDSNLLQKFQQHYIFVSEIFAHGKTSFHR